MDQKADSRYGGGAKGIREARRQSKIDGENWNESS